METPEVTIVGSGKAAPWRRKFTRFRLFTLAVLAALVTVAGVAVWRMRSLDGLPDVGDPFDVSEAARPIPISDEDNAFVSYDAARRMLTTLTLANARSLRKPSTWSNADQQARDYLEQNRLALEKWREGSERPDAIYHQPNEMSVASSLPMAQHLRTFCQLASLEGSRLEEQGAMAGTWSWYIGMLREPPSRPARGTDRATDGVS